MISVKRLKKDRDYKRSSKLIGTQISKEEEENELLRIRNRCIAEENPL